MFGGIHSTVIGDSHIKKGIVCQDSSGVLVNDHYAIAVVADGHGSERHFRSDVGSKLAVKITLGLLEKYMNRSDFSEQFKQHPRFILKQMEKQILMKWREAIEVYQEENPFSEEEKTKYEQTGKGRPKLVTVYGSTILVAVMTDEYSYGIVLGDGGFVVFDEQDQLYIPIEDQNSHANYTSSLCNTNAVGYFEDWAIQGKPKALFVSTDGLYKSFASEEDFLKYHGLIAQMLDNPERAKGSLERNFEKRTRDGSGDDISIALIYRMDQV